MLQEILYTGLGGALLLKERVEDELKQFEEKGKLSKEDAKKFMEELKARGEAEETIIRDEIKHAVKDAISELGLATKEDIERLMEKRN